MPKKNYTNYIVFELFFLPNNVQKNESNIHRENKNIELFLVEYTAVKPHNFLWLFESLPKKITTFRFSWRAPKYLLWSRLEKVKSSNCSITKLENYAHNVRRIYRNARLKRIVAHELALVFIRCSESWLALFHGFYSTNKFKTLPWVLFPRYIKVSMHIFHQGR